MVSLRELFHSLGNKHHLLTVGCGVAKEMVEDCLKEKQIPKDLQEELPKIIKNLERLEKDALEADKITTEIQDRVYEIIDPDIEKP